jgi:hypothetical protein
MPGTLQSVPEGGFGNPAVDAGGRTRAATAGAAGGADAWAAFGVFAWIAVLSDLTAPATHALNTRAAVASDRLRRPGRFTGAAVLAWGGV